MHESYFIEYKAEEEDEVRGIISNGVREMPFCFKSGSNNQNRQLLVILHGHGANKKFAKYRSSEWDILCPLDIYGAEGFGSWWLGEKGDFFVYRLLQELISYIKDKYNLDHLYFWGSSMGGYGAILHGIELGADAVYAHMPQVKLKGTDYTDGINAHYYQMILGDLDDNRFDLTEFIRKYNFNNKSPVFFLSQNVFDYPNYVEQHFIPLIASLSNKQLAYRVEMNLKKGHVLSESIAEVVSNKFYKFSDEIDNWKKFFDIERIDKEKVSTLKRLLEKLPIEVVRKGKNIFIEGGNPLGAEYYYACYLYDEKKLLYKTKYQKTVSFSFDHEHFISNLAIKLYVRCRNSKLRISRVYKIGEV